MTQTHNYEYQIDLDSDLAPARVIRMVKPGSRVLEIGAGPGSITRHLVNTLGCSTVALEVEPTALEKLQQVGCRVYGLDLNQSGWAETLIREEGKFDVVIAADVLEHVYDPWTVLGLMKLLLNDTGSVILSLPHAGHASVVACLVDEDVDYQKWGLLDRTHIRFFGVKNIENLYRSQGLEIEAAEFVVRTPEMTEFVRRWSRLPMTTRTELLKNRFSTVYQVVSRAVPRERLPRGISLFDIEVQLPDEKTVALWTRQMSRVRLQSDKDTRSTWFAKTPAIPVKADSEIAQTASVSETSRATQPRAAEAQSKPTLIAFYLSQFHPIPENDAWWGRGFTEWTNVTKAAPLFNKHYQPHLPSELGFYDLRVRETRRAQIDLAKQYGIGGFCYYYYWFSGKKLLEAPIEDILSDKGSDMPFMLMWANENWTRRWDAAEHEVLIKQLYRPEDDLEFIKSVAPYLRDERYIRLNGAPVLAVYRPQHLPDPHRSIEVWRSYCRAEGIGDLHLSCAYTHGNWDHAAYGFDSGIEFPPHNLPIGQSKTLEQMLHFYTSESCYVMDFSAAASAYLSRQYDRKHKGFRTVFTSWDNTPRRKKGGSVFLNGTPENYEWWLSQAIAKTEAAFPGEQCFVFVNAWNEWAEGAHLEPDQKYGRGFLEATARALDGTKLKGWTNVGITPDYHHLEPKTIHHRGPKSPPFLTKEQLEQAKKSIIMRK